MTDLDKSGSPFDTAADNVSPMGLADRVREAMDSAGLIPADLARSAGCTPANISHILLGRTHSLKWEYAQGIENVTGYRASWLITGKGEKKKGKESHVATTVSAVNALVLQRTIPRIRFLLTPGEPGFAAEAVEGEAVVVPEHLKTHDKLYAITVSGSAMEPALYDGDTAVVDASETMVSDGQVFAFNYDGELLLRRAFRLEGQWVLRSDHPDKRRFPDRPAHPGVLPIGRIVLRQSSVL